MSTIKENQHQDDFQNQNSNHQSIQERDTLNSSNSNPGSSSTQATNPADDSATSYVKSLESVLEVWENFIEENQNLLNTGTDETSGESQKTQSTDTTQTNEDKATSSATDKSSQPSEPTNTTTRPEDSTDPNHQPANSIEEERIKQLTRKNRRTHKEKKKKQQYLTIQSDVPSLDSLILASPMADKIFEKLREPVQNGNPLLGIKVLLRLSDDSQRKYYHLVHFPQLIVESLIMNMQFNEANNVLKEFDDLRDNDTIMFYAQKAVSFPNTNGMKPNLDWVEKALVQYAADNKSDLFTIKVKEWKFNINWNYEGVWSGSFKGVESAEEAIRQSHFFAAGTPNGDLALNILNLSKHKKYGQNLIDLCDYLSDIMCDREISDRILATNIMRELLINAKRYFTTENEHKAALVDSYLQDIDLLRSLLQAKCNFHVSLIDFSDKTKLRQLRDKLIKEDKVELAFSLCSKYNLESDPVWAAWGLYLLKAGQYEQAREKFKKCLGTNRAGKMFSGVILQSILEILESQAEQTQHSRDLEAARFQQSIYYLSEYGTPHMLISFLISHNLVMDACKFVLLKQYSQNVFVDDVLNVCIKLNKCEELVQAIKKLDPLLTQFRDYATSSCHYLSRQNDTHNLLKFQELLGDHVRAGLTLIKLFVESDATSFQEKRVFLERSKDHFLKELDGMGGEDGVDTNVSMNFEKMVLQFRDSNSSISPREANNNNSSTETLMSRNVIHKYIRRIALQMEVSTFFDQHDKKSNRFSIFGSTVHRTLIAEKLVELENYDLALTVIFAFSLPANKVLSNVLNNLVLTAKWKQIKSLVRKAKDIISDKEELDGFILAALKQLVENDNLKRAEKLVPLFSRDDGKIEGYIVCGKLRQAYIESVRIGSRKQVERIREFAKEKNLQTEYRLCDQYLSQNPLSLSKETANAT